MVIRQAVCNRSSFITRWLAFTRKCNAASVGRITRSSDFIYRVDNVMC